MSDNKNLLKRNRNLDNQRIETPTPETTYKKSSLLDKSSKKSLTNNKKTTTARLNYDNLNRANALIAMGLFESFDDLIGALLSDFESNMISDDKITQQRLIESYELKQELTNKRK